MVNIITIDGPAGVGKGTVCKLLAKNLDTRILNSGEIFRTFAILLFISSGLTFILHFSFY